MPLPKDVLDTIKADIAQMLTAYDNLTEIIDDAKEAGYPTEKQEAQLIDLRAKLERAKKFYELQVKRLPAE